MSTIDSNIENNNYEENVMDVKKSVEKSIKNPEIIKREWKLCYCRVLQWDTIPKIRNRLTKYPEFEYLKDPIYGWSTRNVNWFNIEPRHLRPWMELMVPLKIEDRQLDDKAFLESCQRAIDRIKSNQKYWSTVTRLVNKIGVTKLSQVMASFARVETAHGKSGVKIWTWWLYRYESTDTYSVSYYHIVTKWWWAKALANLNMSIWDTCDPVKAWMLFLWYWCEAENGIKKRGLTLEECLNPKAPGRFTKAASIYNH